MFGNSKLGLYARAFVCAYAVLFAHVATAAVSSLPSTNQSGPVDFTTLLKAKMQQIKQYAEIGDADAQYHLGMMYDTGLGGKRDLGQAYRWYQQSAEQGNIKAQNAIGEMYSFGEGVDRDLDKAFMWFEKAAKQGYAPAQDNLGRAFYTAAGTSRDYAAAIYWFEMAANQQLAIAKSSLAWILATCPDTRYRDGERAIRIMETVVSVRSSEPVHLDTLAAAYAETRQFNKAVDMQKAALDVAEEITENQRDQYEKRLLAYLEGKPWRE